MHILDIPGCVFVFRQDGARRIEHATPSHS